MLMTEAYKKLHEVLEGDSQLLILPHNDPDPDAIAASLGLCYLVTERFGMDARVRYRGIIGRAENKALVQYLNYPIRKLNRSEFKQDIPIALVDTQPGTGNNPLPKRIPARIVIDHHAWQETFSQETFSQETFSQETFSQETSSQVRFVDVRPDIGASSTIVTEYLQAAELEIPAPLATALFYGIKTDTMGLGRGVSPHDTAAYFFLQPRVDVDALVRIERAQVPAFYFKSLTSALNNARLYDKDLLISHLGVMNYPDLGAEIADLLLRLQDVKWVICIGVYERDLILSVRSRSRELGAGELVLQIVGDLGTAGGHGTMAGGQIRLNHRDPFSLTDHLTKKALRIIKGNESYHGKPLI
jgi:nanoRNase/pAp phosphatase (c-di-AMP/oligoRNAs hydrolase)